MSPLDFVEKEMVKFPSFKKELRNKKFFETSYPAINSPSENIDNSSHGARSPRVKGELPLVLNKMY